MRKRETYTGSSVHVLCFGQHKLRQLGLNLLALIRLDLHPKIATILVDALPEFDGGKLSDLR